MNVDNIYLPGLGYLNKCSECGKSPKEDEPTNIYGWCFACITRYRKEQAALLSPKDDDEAVQ